MHDGVCDTVRALPAAQLGIHQEGSGGTAREESKQAEDRVVPQEAGAAGRGEDGAGYTACVQDEAIRVADARLRKGVYTPKGGPRRLHVHGIALQDHRVRPDHAGRGGVLPEIRLLYREGVCRVPEGRMRKVREDPDDNRRRAAAQVEVRQGGDRAPGRRVELQFLPPGCPDLNAIEEVRRQMKHAVLDVPYVRFSSMCSDIDRWLRSSLPKLDIERYLYRKA